MWGYISYENVDADGHIKFLIQNKMLRPSIQIKSINFKINIIIINKKSIFDLFRPFVFDIKKSFIALLLF